MPYKDPAKYKAYQQKYRQEHLFEAEVYREENKPRQRGYEQTHRQRNRASFDGTRGRIFAGFDGEGHGDGPDHNYYLLRMGDQELRTGQPLGTYECLELIADNDPDLIYCVYFGTYDCTMILRGLPRPTLDALMNRASRAHENKNGRTVFNWVEWEGFRLDYIPRKRLTVARGDGSPISVHDVGGFFQESFARRLEDGRADGAVVKWNENNDIASDVEIDILCEGKAGRGDWDALSDKTAYYNQVECDVLARLMAKLNNATHAVGLEAAPYEGAGNLAGSMYNVYVAKPHRAKKESAHPPKPPKAVPCMGAYYGGRFEITAHGPVPRRVYEYDVASAYPAAMLDLSCLWHGKWMRGVIDDATVQLGYIGWNPKPNANRFYGPLPVRIKQGNIMFPLRGQGWYWDCEWPNDAEYDVDLLDCWSYVQECTCKPYDWIRGVYAARKEMGKSGKGYVLKLAMNSLYGKTAQTVGQAPWANHAYAGLITAMTRRKLRDAADMNPEAVIMFATDAVYTTEPLELPLSGELGGWEMQEYEDGLHLVLPGIYFDKTGAKVKTRGIGRKTLVEYQDQIIAAFDQIENLNQFDPNQAADAWGCEVEYNGLITLKLAWSQGKPEKAGYFGKLKRRISYYCEPKRPISSLYKDSNGVWRSLAPSSAGAPSVPYKPVYTPDHEFEEMMDAAPEELANPQFELF
jgi:hypothetical protein